MQCQHSFENNIKEKVLEYYAGINNNATFFSFLVSCKNFAKTVGFSNEIPDIVHDCSLHQVYDFY